MKGGWVVLRLLTTEHSGNLNRDGGSGMRDSLKEQWWLKEFFSTYFTHLFDWKTDSLEWAPCIPNRWLKLWEEHESWIRHVCLWMLLCHILCVTLGHCALSLLLYNMGFMKSFRLGWGNWTCFSVCLSLCMDWFKFVYSLIWIPHLNGPLLGISLIALHLACVYLQGLWELGREWK